MKKAFISYRRQDSAGYVRAVHDRLVEHFDPGQIFMDVDDIPLGTDFVEELDKNLRGCTVMLVVIGPQWITIRNSRGERRLENPEDFVRLEVRQAIERGLTVIPILVQGAMMPGEQQLPEDLKALSRRQALELDNKHFDHGVKKLIIALEHHLGKPASQPDTTPDTRSRIPLLLSIAGLLFAAMIAALLWVKPLLEDNGGIFHDNGGVHEVPKAIAGFDCRNANNDVEDVICNSDRTRQADQQMNQAYQQISAKLPPAASQRLRTRQLNWLQQRNAHIRQNCLTQPNHGRITQCIYNYYQQRISTLSRMPTNLLNRVRLKDPHSDIRQEPNGSVICQIDGKQMIEVYNNAVQERDGQRWYWTRVCGDKRWGVVHETQISQVN